MSAPRDADQEFEENQEAREAEIATGVDGGPLGVCIYLTPTDLEALGIDSSETEQLSYVVEDGQLDITESEER